MNRSLFEQPSASPVISWRAGAAMLAVGVVSGCLSPAVPPSSTAPPAATASQAPTASPAAPATTPAAITAASLHVVDQQPIHLAGRQIALSPDGERVVVDASTVLRSNSRLCVYELASQAELSCAELSSDGVSNQIDARALAWAPGSDRIALNEDLFVRLLEPDLWVWAVNSGEVLDLTADGVSGHVKMSNLPAAPLPFDMVPAWSPDGTQLVFFRIIGQTRHSELRSIDANGGESSVLSVIAEDTVLSSWGTRWRDNRIFYTLAGPSSDARSGVYVMSADGTAARSLMGRDPERGQPFLVDATSDGRFALIRYDEALLSRAGPSTGTYELIDVDSNAVSPIVHSGSAGTPPSDLIIAVALSPDGSKIAYTINDPHPAGGSTLVVRDRAGGPENVLVTPVDARFVDPDGLAWPAGDVIYIRTAPDRGLLLTLGSGG